MQARGFNSVWRRWMQHILHSSRTAVLVNGCPGPWMHCRRGLRQGDPISPYLFILVADVLQILIRKSGLIIHPIAENTACPVLQYADDTLLLIRGELTDAQSLRNLLDQFASATGLQINYTKSRAVPIHMNEVQFWIVSRPWDAAGRDFPKHTLDCRYQIPSFVYQHLPQTLPSVINILLDGRHLC